MKNIYKIIIYTITISFFLFYSSQAQFTGYGNDQAYQSAMNVYDIDSLPPLSTSMDSGVIFSYKYIDSLSQVTNSKDVDNFPIRCSVDSLKFLVSIEQRLREYDEMLFWSYCSKTNNMWENHIKYKVPPITIISQVEYWIFHGRMSDIGEQYEYPAYMPYIYHIRADSIVVGVDSSGDFGKYDWVNVSATILNIIKGKPPCNCMINNNGGKKNFQNDTVRKSCINFGFLKDWLTNTGTVEERYSNTHVRTPVIGKEYIVLLETVAISLSMFIIAPNLRWEITGGIFEINDGMVYDPSKFFSKDTITPLQVFIDSIKSNIKTVDSWLHIKPSSIIENNDNIKSPILYPNPTDSYLNISGYADIEKAEVVDLLGMTVIKFEGEVTKLNVSSLSTGIYALRLHYNGNKTKTLIFIKK